MNGLIKMVNVPIPVSIWWVLIVVSVLMDTLFYLTNVIVKGTLLALIDAIQTYYYSDRHK